MLRIRFVILSLILLLCLPSCGKKRRDFASYPLQNPQGIDFEGDPEFVSSYMRYLGIADGQKNPGKGASIFELDSVEELEEFEPVDAGWEVDKIPPGKTDFEEFLTDNLDALKTNITDAVKQANDSFGAVANVTKKSLAEQRGNNVKRRSSKRARRTFRSAASKSTARKSNNSQGTTEIAGITVETEAENVTVSSNTQEKSNAQERNTAFEETDLQSDQSTQNVGELLEPSAEGLPETDDIKTEDSRVAHLEQKQMSVDKEENSDLKNRDNSRPTEELNPEKTDHETATPGAEDSGSSDPSQSGSENDQKSRTAKDNQYGNLTWQNDSTLNTKIEDSSFTESSHSESVDDQKREAVQEEQDGSVTQQDSPFVCTCDGIDETEEESQNDTLSAEENVSQQNNLTVDPCECSCCSETNEVKEEVQKSIPPIEKSKAVQATQSSCAKHTLKSGEALAKILPGLPFCKNECASTVIYSTDPIIENVQGDQSEEEN
ncbi:hypothetical protein [Neorickettsia sennetsu]|uniref:Uncharacterized protein n=1 Tax=Ehrlichia sennetsu (strain ATCC VR-367 / Miyayama) TaxID=222891 RepID=Q2GDH5_EHRS3|nr:hypothetical protein [Neorickettsia sennetsu]ABD45767.1 hypothetical protein NSE_0591 [Neorickettsia sennetsu str. Miyayama]